MPGTAVAVTAAVVAALQIPAAQASPNLPNRTPAQLLASISSDAKVPPMTGTVVETASLGLPQLPQTGNPTSLASLLTGSHTVKVYYQDANHFRLAVPQPQSETDVIADGSKLWLWQSSSDSVTEFVPPAVKGKVKHSEPKLPQTPLTPQQAANQVLAAVGKTTLVSVQANVMVAGEPSYQLVLAPKDSPLAGRPGRDRGRRQVRRPAPRPAVREGREFPRLPGRLHRAAVGRPRPGQLQLHPAERRVRRRGEPRQAAGQVRAAAASRTPAASAATARAGSPWWRFPQKDLMQGFGTAAGSSGSASSSGKQQNIYSANNQGVGVSSQELLNALLGSAKPVHGSWGSGTLVTTSLVSMLMTGGEVYIGAVQPSVLYAAVGHTTS